METLRITGGTPLRGTVPISGSKNATLPVMAAALLSDEPVELDNVPDIEDISTMAEMLRHVGVDVDRTSRGQWRVHARRVDTIDVGADMTKRLRGSFLLLGALTARAKEARIAKPGGDDIGMRRVEQHLEGLRHMGAEVEEQPDMYVARATRLRGARIDLDMPTVTGTENLMMAAVLADGITVISNAAREPHVVDLARCLQGMGAYIDGAGSDQVVIEGTGGVLLHGTRHSVTPDYIEAGTYLVAAAATMGEVTADRMRPADVRWLINKLRAAGCRVVEGSQQVSVSADRLRAVDATSWPHPGFATDLQSQYVALMTQAHGTSVVSEAVFENRFHHVKELCKFGADVTAEGRSAIIHGPARLTATHATVPDIRSGAALVIAALCADGTSELENIFHLQRGYQDLEDKLRSLGADVERVGTDVAGANARDFSAVVGD